MKQGWKGRILTVILICMSYLGLFAQTIVPADRGAKLSKIESKFINSRTADSLIRIGQYYRVFWGGDFRAQECKESIGKKYNFKPYYVYQGCIVYNQNAKDSIKKFNVLMDSALSFIYGNDCSERFYKEINSCIYSLCSIKDSLDRYFYEGQFEGIRYLYQPKQVVLDEIQKCIISHQLFKLLNEYPDIGVEVIGNSIKEEDDEKMTVSSKRAENFYNYLVNLGISKTRLKLSSYGYIKPVYPPEQNKRNMCVSLRIFYPDTH